MLPAVKDSGGTYNRSITYLNHIVIFIIKLELVYVERVEIFDKCFMYQHGFDPVGLKLLSSSECAA